MEFGVAFASKVGDFGHVALAESLGFDHAWFFDSQMIYSDVYATMALAAHHTSSIRLGTGVAVPTTRIAPTIAHSIATVAQLAPGRVELGVGTGNTARLTMGCRPISLTVMKREIAIIRKLLRGEEAMLEVDGELHPVKLLHPHRGFIDISQPIPISVSAFGPKTLAYCGAESDGHITWGLGPREMRDTRKALDEAARAAGRQAADVPSKGIFPLAVLRAGESSASPRVLRSLESFITNFLHVQVEWGEDLLKAEGPIAEWIERYREHTSSLPKERAHLTLHEGHLVYARDDEREFIVPELAEAVAMIGEPDALIERIRALEDAGLKQFAFQVTDDPKRQIEDFARAVIERY